MKHCYTCFFPLEKKVYYYINFLPKSVSCPSVCAYVCLTFLVNASPPKPFDIALQTLQVNRSHDIEGTEQNFV